MYPAKRKSCLTTQGYMHARDSRVMTAVVRLNQVAARSCQATLVRSVVS
jgi:hypothetical protein